MSERWHSVSDEPPARLQEAIRKVKTAAADREDVVVEMREAERMRLELIAQELAPVIAGVSPDDQRFDFALTSGLQPRFWIDAVSHVAMGRDRRTYRFVRDTRLGRVVLAESSDLKPVAEQVTLYIAERMVERERMMEGDIIQVDGHRFDSETRPLSRDADDLQAMPPEWGMLLGGLLLIGTGAMAGVVASLALLWAQGMITC